MPNWRKGVQGPQRKYRKTRRGNYLGKKATTNVRKIAKNTILRMAETKAVGKQSGGSPTVPAIALFHNQPYYISNLLATKQGTADPNDYSSAAARVGDELQLKTLMFASAFLDSGRTVPIVWFSSGMKQGLPLLMILYTLHKLTSF